MTLQQIRQVLLAHRNVALALFLVTVLTTLVVSLLLPKEYTATATVVIDVKSPDPVSGMVLPGMMQPGYMATQMDIINSDRVAYRVVSSLKMDTSPVIRQQWQEEAEGRGTVAQWMAPLLKKKLDVKPSRDSSVIEIGFNGADPNFSAAIANAFAQAYIDTTIDLRVDQARQYAARFDEQIKTQRKRLDDAQRALSEYQQRSGIVSTDERLDYETQKLNELSGQLTLVQVQGNDATSKQGKNASETLPEVIQSPLINQLRAEVARMESKLQEVSGNLGQNHPQYLRSQAELDALKAKLQAEIGRITSSIVTAGNVSVAKEAEIKAAIEQQKGKVFELRKERDEINLMMREVETAQRAYDAVSQRLTQSNLEAQTIQTNVSVLTPAVPPFEHSQPKIFLNMLVAVFLGALLAAGAVLVLEMARPRIRSREDLAGALRIPVLAQLDAVVTDGKKAGKGLAGKLGFNNRKQSSEIAAQA